jgi:mRNA-degrading endonuclease RelE of RelBE toxin-antitoxin system
MKYDIFFAPAAREDYEDLSAFDRAAVRDAINVHLAHQPDRESKSKIKRLREVSKPHYRLRVGQIRVFYDVRGSEVEVLGIVDKHHAEAWLQKWGVRI